MVTPTSVTSVAITTIVATDQWVTQTILAVDIPGLILGYSTPYRGRRDALRKIAKIGTRPGTAGTGALPGLAAGTSAEPTASTLNRYI